MRVSSRFSCAVLAGYLVLCGRSVEAQGPSGQAHPHVQQILLLQGIDRGSVTVDSFTANFRVDLDERVGTPRATANGTWRSRLTPAAVRRCRR